MCGLFGYLTPRHDQIASKRTDACMSLLRHRGPNDQGLIDFKNEDLQLYLGHTRLSILDLSMAGHQPMHSIDGRYTIIFNGEIYNYRELRRHLEYPFHSDSDTEVLLAAWVQWGHACLSKLTGMFALAILDRLKSTLYLARDAFGIKPLFYTHQSHGEIWAFASELPALLQLLTNQPTLNLQRAYDYLVSGSYDDQTATLFNGISHLLPGHWLEISLENGEISKPVRWWWPSITERTDLSFNQAADELRERFLSSVQLHLRSDVPLGAALSGGIDSSAVVCAMRHLEPKIPIHTFTFIAPGADIDEESWADQVNAHVDAIPHKVSASSEELAADLDAMILAQGEPFGSTSIYAQYRVFRAAREAGITVTLDGQGADELLAGYSGYPHARLRSLINQKDVRSALSLLYRWSQWPGRGRRRASVIAARALLPEAILHPLHQLYTYRRTPWLNRTWFKERGITGISTLSENVPTDIPVGRNLAAALRQAATGSTIGGLAALLRHGDRNSMHWSIESRVPFLTTDLAEFLLSLPEEYLLSPTGQTKYIFRSAMRGIIPDNILDRRDKIGFATPEQAWLRQLAPTIDQWLDSAQDIPFLDHSQLHRTIQAAVLGQAPVTWQIWRLINFCRWVTLMRPVF